MYDHNVSGLDQHRDHSRHFTTPPSDMHRSLLSLLQQSRLSHCAVTVTSTIGAARSTFLRTHKTYHYNPITSQARKDSTWGFLETYYPAVIKENAKRTAEEIWESNSQLARDALARHPLANAYTGMLHYVTCVRSEAILVSGRSVKVFNGNIAEAFKRLEQCLSRNRVRSELKLTERHEKKGAKRRRLESERWRIRFANEV